MRDLNFNPDNSGVKITLKVFGSALFLEHEIDIKLYKLQHESGKFEDKIAPILKQLRGLFTSQFEWHFLGSAPSIERKNDK